MKRITRCISLCLCLMITAALCSCKAEKTISEVADSAQSAVEGMSMPKIEAPSLVVPDNSEAGGRFSSISEINAQSKSYNKIELKAGFNALGTDVERYFYNRLESDVYIVGSKENDRGLYLIDKIFLNDAISEKEIRVTLSAFKNDHPEVFWLSNQFSYIPSTATEIQLYSVITPEEIEKKSDELITAIEFFINKIPEGLSEFERELKIHDLLLGTCVYNEEVESTSDDWRPFSIYGSLVDGNAVCEGYSRAMQYLLSVFGIECNTINGMGKGNPHQWNCVKIDGEWYHLDATWDDTTDNNIYYDYFNVSDSAIAHDHETAPLFSDMTADEICGGENLEAKLFNIAVPQCSSDAENFYTMKAVTYSGENEESKLKIEDKLADCIAYGSDVIYIMVDSAYDYEQALNELFYNEPFLFFTYIEDTNVRCGEILDNEHASVLKRERQSIIEVHLQYKTE